MAPSALAFFTQRRTLDLEMCKSAAVSLTLLPPFISSITFEQSTLCLAYAVDTGSIAPTIAASANPPTTTLILFMVPGSSLKVQIQSAEYRKKAVVRQ